MTLKDWYSDPGNPMMLREILESDAARQALEFLREEGLATSEKFGNPLSVDPMRLAKQACYLTGWNDCWNTLRRLAEQLPKTGLGEDLPQGWEHYGQDIENHP